jgi:putative flippase GtrA
MRDEIAKFGVVGATTFCLDSAIYFVFRITLHEPLTAKTIAAVIAATVAFLGNRFWTWRDRPRSGLGREYALYAVANGIGLVVQLACVGISHYGLGSLWPETFRSVLADMVSGNVVGMAIATTFRFWSYRTFVFRPQGPGSDRATAPEPSS